MQEGGEYGALSDAKLRVRNCEAFTVTYGV